MTKKEFEKQYAKNSSVPLDELRSKEMSAYPCHCGEAKCKGWQMLSRGSAEMMVNLGLMTVEDAAVGLS